MHCTHAPCATRLAASIACPADRRPLKRDAFGLPLALLAGWELRRRSRGRQAHHRHGFRRSEVHHGGHRRAVAHQDAGGRMASLMASLSAVGSRSRVAGGLPQPGRGLGRRARAHGHFACACLSCTQLSTAFCAASASRGKNPLCQVPPCVPMFILCIPKSMGAWCSHSSCSYSLCLTYVCSQETGSPCTTFE